MIRTWFFEYIKLSIKCKKLYAFASLFGKNLRESSFYLWTGSLKPLFLSLHWLSETCFQNYYCKKRDESLSSMQMVVERILSVESICDMACDWLAIVLENVNNEHQLRGVC